LKIGAKPSGTFKLLAFRQGELGAASVPHHYIDAEYLGLLTFLE